MRLIDADALIENIKSVCCTDCNSYEGVRCRSCWADDAMSMVDDAPIIDAAPVVHAKWSDDGICSACGNEASYSEWIEKIFDYDWDENLIEICEEVHGDHHLTEYCPTCGARMDGDPHESGQ